MQFNSIKVINVPQYKGLRVNDIIKLAASKINIDLYLPDYEYSKRTQSRVAIIHYNSLIPKEFQIYKSERMDAEKHCCNPKTKL